jgi:hypothetical protein
MPVRAEPEADTLSGTGGGPVTESDTEFEQENRNALVNIPASRTIRMRFMVVRWMQGFDPVWRRRRINSLILRSKRKNRCAAKECQSLMGHKQEVEELKSPGG